MLLQCFGFTRDPFGATPDPSCLFQSNTHREALASLKYAFYSNRGFTAMIAAPGMGKTTLLNCFLNDIRESARTVFLFNIDSLCQPSDLVGFILRDMGITPGKSSAEMHDQMNEAIAEEARAGRILAIVIDEAQNLSEAALEKVRMLTNFETATGKLIQIVLSGQPQLSEKLMQHSLVQLRQRISTICRLEPFPAEEIRAYIDHHLKVAGYTGDALFTPDALKLIEDASQGIPRLINNLCFNALSLCRALKKKQVDADVAAEAIADHQLVAQGLVEVTLAKVADGRPRAHRKRMNQLGSRWVMVAAEMLLACTLGAFGLSELGSHHIQIGDVVSSLSKVIDKYKPQQAVTVSAQTLTAGDSGQTRLSELLSESDRTVGGVTGPLQGEFTPRKIDAGYIDQGSQVLASKATGNEAHMLKPADSTLRQNDRPAIGSTTNEQTELRDLRQGEMMIDQLTAPRRTPRMPQAMVQLEAPPAGGFGETSLTGRDSLDAIGGVFKSQRGVEVRPETTPRIVEIPSEVADSLVISKIAPQYPSAAKVARISGRVLIQATISATGTIESLHVLSGPDVLRKAAIDAVSKWRFRPYKLNDRPAAAEIRVGVSFNLGG